MDDYSTEGSSVRKGFKSNGSSFMYGSSQSDVYDWMADIVMPPDYKVCKIIEIKFKGSRKEFYLNHQNIYFKNGELAVVEGTLGGYDVGHVSLTGELVRMQLRKKNVRTEEVVKKIYRRATPADVTKWKLAKEMELDTLYKARVLTKALGLSMKLTDVDYQGDTSKATFYYTAKGRVDYRELIKDLSKAFHIRIEMRQIGIREEACRIGDIGPCGSYICCHTWSTNFKTDSPFETRYQNISRREGRKFQCYINDETLNKDGSTLDDLKDKTRKNNKSLVAKPLFYANVVGQDSITRFDTKEKKGKKNNLKNKKQKQKQKQKPK
ncbi:PSP1 domain-containing protein [Psychroserpens burtonensis]|uniref:PSP1 domain-containing protein n=1 Tax=Psychroserpens burtonensis TaxID=49278 RepID=UPI00041C0C37|nr:regulatory iron-sulfur-containing complex subunit RicT [Psychroserpens burtonensis]